ncbi:RCC1 domain-containing protein [Brachybacterium sp. SGAir0954]
MIDAGLQHSVACREDGTVLAAGSDEDGRCRVGAWR